MAEDPLKGGTVPGRHGGATGGPLQELYDMKISDRDRSILRDLACRLAEVAAAPVQAQNLGRWRALNGLRPQRPMVMIDQVPWHEMDVDGELALQTEAEFCRGLETDLRRLLYHWRHMPADRVFEAAIEVPKCILGTDFGLDTVETQVAVDSRNTVVSHAYTDLLETEQDVDKIRDPVVALDAAATARSEEAALSIFDGLLDVRMQGLAPMLAPWDRIVTWHPPEQVLLDLVCRPAFMHRIIARLTAAHMALLDQLESQGLLAAHQRLIHCTGASADELPASGWDPTAPRAKDLWTCGMAQMFASVSPAMHQEFELDYGTEWYRRFGLVYYGCCEPLDAKIDLVRLIPNLRKISISPWADQEAAAARIGPDFVFSRKPNPAFLAAGAWDPAAVEQDLRATVECCARHGCPVELILKDISTVRYEPQRLWQWAAIAARVVEEEY